MIKNKKIMMLATTDNMIWQFLIPHVQHLQSLGNTVECVCSKTGFWFDELKDKYNFKMHEIDFNRNPISLKNFKAYKQLKKLQKEEKFDLIYSQQPVGGLMGRLLGKKFKLPVIYTAHGFHFFKGCSFKRKIVYKTIETWLSRYTDALITINDDDFEFAKKMHAKKVYKINGIGFTKKQNLELTETKHEIRQSLGLNDDDFVVLTVAEFIKRKNYDTMLKTISNLKDKRLKYVICGTGRDKDLIEKQILDLHIEDQVILLGYRKDVDRIMMASDCFFLASHQEGLTLSVIEAMTFGLPCVVSDVRGNRDLIENGKGGFVVQENDDVNFANKINELKNNTIMVQSMKEYNLTESAKYSIEKVQEQLYEIYKEM